MAKLARFTGPQWDLDVSYYFNDFFNFTTATDGVTSLAADAGATAVVADARKGILALTTGAVDNNEAAVRTTTELFLLADAKPLFADGLLQFSEAATDDANVFFGFASAAGADLLVNDGAGPRTTGNIIGIYKVDGGTVWRCISRNGATATDTVSTTPAGGAAAQRLKIRVGDWDGTAMWITYEVDAEKLRDSTGNVIRHAIAIASATEMHLVAYVKAGGGASEVLNVDYIYGDQLR